MDTTRMDRSGPPTGDDSGAAEPGEIETYPSARGNHELEAIANALQQRAGVDLPERELIRMAALVLDDVRDFGYDVVYTYPDETPWTTDTAADE